MSKRIAGLAGGVAILGLAACAEPPGAITQPAFYQNLSDSGAELDAQSARDMINAYRANNGAAPVEIDPRLGALAQAYAAELARSASGGTAMIRPDGRIEVRFAAAGYDYAHYRESVSAGYYTFAEAFSGWRDSEPHRQTMLFAPARHMGVAAVALPGTRHRVYWVLVMAAPAER